MKKYLFILVILFPLAQLNAASDCVCDCPPINELIPGEKQVCKCTCETPTCPAVVVKPVTPPVTQMKDICVCTDLTTGGTAMAHVFGKQCQMPGIHNRSLCQQKSDNRSPDKIISCTIVTVPVGGPQYPTCVTYQT